MSATDNTTPHKSSEYDRSVRQTIPFYETIQSQVVDLVRTIKPDVNCWLDTGCGTGYLAEIAMPYFPATAFILTDPSESMLKQAADRLKGREDRVKFLAPLPSQDLDLLTVGARPQVITVVLSHHYLHQPQRLEATRACYSLLDENGLYVTVENIRPATDEGISSGLERWKRFQVGQGRPGPVVREHARRFDKDYFPITAEEHLALLRETGLRNADVFWYSHMQAGFFGFK